MQDQQNQTPQTNTTPPDQPAPASEPAQQQDAEAKAPGFTLPEAVVSHIDINRMLREVNQLDDFMMQAGIRKGGSPVELPRVSNTLEKTAADNHLNLLVAEDRKRLKNVLDLVRTKAPVIHMSFAADPSGVFITKLLIWLRQQIHPFVLLHIGLQPEIAAGTIMRSTNHMFDFSFRKHFDDNKGMLLKAISDTPDKTAEAGPPAAEVPEPPIPGQPVDGVQPEPQEVAA